MGEALRLGDGDDWLTYVFRTLTVHRAEIAVRKHNEDIQREVPVKPGEPLHVVITYDHDGADGKPLLGYFRDGEPFGTMRVGSKLSDVEDTQNRIGPFASEFDELRVYDYPLSGAEVRGSFASGPDKLRVGAAPARNKSPSRE